MKTFVNQDGKKFERVSRWIEKKTAYDVHKNSSLYEYATDENGYNRFSDNFNPENGTYCDYYVFNRIKYAVDRFYLLSNPFYMQGYNEHLVSNDGEHVELHAVDMDGDMFNPLYIELSNDCEYARFYRCIE